MVWVGFDNPKTIVSRGFGSTLSLPTWVGVMRAAEERRYPRTALRAPRGLRQSEVCAVSGLLAHGGCRAAGAARGIALPGERIPDERCRTHAEQAPGLFQRWFR